MHKDHNGRRALAAILFALILCVGAATAAFAQTDPYSNDGPTVKASLITRDSDPQPEPAESRHLLPFTGGDVTIVLLGGLIAISAGSLIVRRSRRAGDEA